MAVAVAGPAAAAAVGGLQPRVRREGEREERERERERERGETTGRCVCGKKEDPLCTVRSEERRTEMRQTTGPV